MSSLLHIRDAAQDRGHVVGESPRVPQGKMLETQIAPKRWCRCSLLCGAPSVTVTEKSKPMNCTYIVQ